MKQNISTIQNILSDAKKRYLSDGIELLGIFGSYAQGKADVYSDIDIAYRVDREMFDHTFHGGFAKLLRLKEIKQELEKRLRCKIDLVSVEHSSARFKEEIFRKLVHV